jgi:multidrug efflux pump subunit AcrA (membrane-fusion protein)
MSRFRWFCVLATALCGCSENSDSEAPRERAPRPVSVIRIQESDPARSLAVTGIVGSWKTEDIGFEVSGRVNYVIEPETNISGPGRDKSDEQPLARIDPEKYETAVESASAQINVFTRQKTAAEIERDQVIPAERDAAVAGQELAQAEFGRGRELFDRKAIAKSEFDQNVANLKSAQARVAQIGATQEAKAAEITSLEAQIEQARAALRDAQRDLNDCTIHAPFRGQIARVHVIPGGTAQRGEPVVTLQMMDPVKIEFEVSSERARQMHYQDGLDITLKRPDGTEVSQEAVIWMTDAAADASTRTFTITLLIRNRLVPADVPEDVDREVLTKTRDIWAFIQGILDGSDRYFVDEDAIHKDEQGEFVWRIIDPGDGQQRSRGPLLTVEKVRVTAGDERTGFLGLWTFRDLTVDDPSTFDPDQDRVLGKLVLPAGATEMSSDTVLFEREQWLLRPGDLVGVDLNENRLPRGVYVPIDAVTEKSGRNYVFAVEESAGASQAQRVEVSVSDGPNTLKRIEAVGDVPLNSGTLLVRSGVHYLTDGEAVNIASVSEAN